MNNNKSHIINILSVFIFSSILLGVLNIRTTKANYIERNEILSKIIDTSADNLTVPLPPSAIYCADEAVLLGQPPSICSFNGLATVYYGANDKYYYKENILNSITCDNDTFGDPIYGAVKSCYYLLTEDIPPSVVINQSSEQSDPTNTGPIEFIAIFTELITGFNGSDIDFSGSTAEGDLIANVSGTGPTYDISVSGMTGSGTVIVSIPSGAVEDLDGMFNTESTSMDNSVTFDMTLQCPAYAFEEGIAVSVASPPGYAEWYFDVGEVTFHPSLPDGTVITYRTFLTSNSLGTLMGDITGGPVTVIGGVADFHNQVILRHTWPPYWLIRFVFSANGCDIQPYDDSRGIDTTPINVSVEQSIGQSDPTSNNTINFTAIFSEEVTDFESSDVKFIGSSANGYLNADITGSDSVYNIAVSGMSNSGTVLVSIPAGTVEDIDGVLNTASSSIDNSVTYIDVIEPVPSVTIDQAVGQVDPSMTGPINFTAIFSEPVTGFDGNEVIFTGSSVSGVLNASVSGSASVYNIAVTGMTDNGLVVITIPAGISQDSDGNKNIQSTSVDNTVRFEITTPEPGTTVLRVVPDGTKTENCGGGWNLFDPVSGYRPCDLQFALTTRSEDVELINGNLYELWVKSGIYYPTIGDTPSREDTFNVGKGGVDIYGGFSGTETKRDERNWIANPTILSGDIDGEGSPPSHSYHVVTINAPDILIILDGFIIQDGQADVESYYYDDPCSECGGGILVESAYTYPLLRNLIIQDNTAIDGGGLYGNARLENVTISNNSAEYGGGIYGYGDLENTVITHNTANYGGGMYGSYEGNYVFFTENIANNNGGGIYGSPSLMNCIISNNSSINGNGGGVASDSNLDLEKCTIEGNNASNGDGGGIYQNSTYNHININNSSIKSNNAVNGGGLSIDGRYVTITSSTINGNTATNGGGLFLSYIYDFSLTNSTIVDNTAIRGGGIYNYNGNLDLIYVTISSNIADYGGGIYNTYTSEITASGTILWGNKRPDNVPDQVYNFTSSAIFNGNYIDIQGGCPASSDFVCTNTINNDPLFGPLGNYGGYTNTIPLLSNSPAIDKIPKNTGSPLYCKYYWFNITIDQRGIRRPISSGCDLGAYELGSQAYIPLLLRPYYSPTPTRTRTTTPTRTPTPTRIPTRTHTPQP
jgi:hypothetical protein